MVQPASWRPKRMGAATQREEVQQAASSCRKVGQDGGGGRSSLLGTAVSPAWTRFLFSISQGETSTLTFILDNSANAIDATGAGFTDAFPAGLIVAATPDLANTCGGTIAAAAGGDTLELTGGTIPENGTCEISVAVQATAHGSLTNTTKGRCGAGTPYPATKQNGQLR